MNVITRTLHRREDSLTFHDGQTGHGEYRMSAAEWVEMGKPSEIIMQIIPAARESGEKP